MKSLPLTNRSGSSQSFSTLDRRNAIEHSVDPALKGKLFAFRQNYFRKLHTDLYRHSLNCSHIIIARGLSSYQVTTVHLVIHASQASSKLAKERFVKSLNFKRLFITPHPTPQQMLPYRKRTISVFFEVCSSNVRLPVPILIWSVSCIIYFKKKEWNPFSLWMN